MAEAQGIPVLQKFFGKALAQKLASEGKSADLLVGNNVYAHVPEINDFTEGLKILLKPGGTITMEFPHLLRLITETQFDTIYHEHFSYLSLQVVCGLFEKAGLRVWDVEEHATQGGSLRIYGGHAEAGPPPSPAVARVLEAEQRAGLQELDTYRLFLDRTETIKMDLLSFLIEQKRKGKTVAAYGAAAKGNTLLNFAGIHPDLLPFVCDAALSKQGKFLPGSHIPIRPPAALRDERPDFVLILPWNIKQEIMDQHAYIRDWGGQFVVAAPVLEVQ
jgi:hypothetical protein